MNNESENKSEIFYERTDINEFLREHPMVSDLYDATLQVLYTLNKLPLRYKEWDNTLLAYKNKCESLATYFGVSMPYRHGVRKP